MGNPVLAVIEINEEDNYLSEVAHSLWKEILEFSESVRNGDIGRFEPNEVEEDDRGEDDDRRYDQCLGDIEEVEVIKPKHLVCIGKLFC